MNFLFASWVPGTWLGYRERFKKCELATFPTVAGECSWVRAPDLARSTPGTETKECLGHSGRASREHLCYNYHLKAGTLWAVWPISGGGTRQRPFCLSSPASSEIEINHFLRVLCVFYYFPGSPQGHFLLLSLTLSLLLPLCERAHCSAITCTQNLVSVYKTFS